MATVLVIGGTGLVGSHLCKQLKHSGFNVTILSQNQAHTSEFPIFHWNWKQQKIDESALQNCDFIIHLAGANIASERWSKKRKKIIFDSRVQSTLFLQQKLKELQLSPTAFITASAVGYYGMITDLHIYSESDLPSTDFLGHVCSKWENAAQQVYNANIRTVQLRTGIVLTSSGGALEKMANPIRYGLGTFLGSGKQYMPWIHITDLCNMYIRVIKDPKIKGIYNATAPEHQTNRSFSQLLAKKLNKRIWLPPAPSIILKLALGEMAKLLLTGSRISSKKIETLGFKFKYPKLDEALDNLLK